MRSRSVLKLLMLAGSLVGSRALASPLTVELQPPPTVMVGEAASIAVRMGGLGAESPAVKLHFRGASETAYQTLPMKAQPDGLFAATIPAHSTNDVGLRYYVVVTGTAGIPGLTLGSARTPFRLDLATPPAVASGSLLPVLVGVGSVLLLAAALALRSRERNRRTSIAEQLFWIKVLHPLVGLSIDAASARLQKLAQTPLNHPATGLTMFPYQTMVRKLRELRKIDIQTIVKEHAALARELGVPIVDPETERLNQVADVAAAWKSRTADINLPAADPLWSARTVDLRLPEPKERAKTLANSGR